MLVYRKDNLAYLPITKNASKTFSWLFQSLNWKEDQFDLLEDGCKLFSHIQDPIERHFKGTAEFIIRNDLLDLVDDVRWQKIWATAVMDIHGYPITYNLGKWRDQIHWIPIHEGIDTNHLTIQFLEQHGVYVDSIKNVAETYSIRTELVNKLKEIATTHDKECTLSYFYDSDIVEWIKVLNSL